MAFQLFQKENNMVNKEIKITQVSNRGKFVAFKINGVEDGILVGLPSSYDNCITIDYKGDMIIVPFSATSDELEIINKGTLEDNKKVIERNKK